MTALRIVVPVLNEGLALGPRLAALRSLRERGAELVVVDGGSDDETWLVASRLADEVRVAPAGRAAQMNAGARDCAADVLLFLHADTGLPPQADRLIAAAVDSGALWGRFDACIDSPRPLLRLAARLMNQRSRWTGIATGDQAIFVRRDVFEDVGGFPEIALMEDVALSARLRSRAAPACLRPPVVTSARRWESHGIVRTILLMWMLRLRYFLGSDPQVLADRYGYGRRPPAASAAIAVMAKAPVAGLAKTRLAAAIGARAAARTQREFTLDTLRKARAAALGPVRLWCAPDDGHRLFRALRRSWAVETSAQAPGDLGQRMRAAVEHHFSAAPHLPLLVVGTDCPLLSPGQLQAAARALVRHDAVLIPAEDGGYVLLGLRRPLPEVFADVAWSTHEVLAQTRERLRAAGASWCELGPLWDVDEAPDWRRYRELLGAAMASPVEVHA